jgi:hypothetical protein
VNRPDLIIVGFGNAALRVDILESIRLVPPFKRASDHLLMFKEMTRYSDVSVITVIIDDPDFSSDDLYVVFYTTPTERQYPHINEAVIDIEKRITAWFHGTLYLVDHMQYATLCTIRKNKVGDDDEPLENAMESVGTVADVFHTRDEALVETGEIQLNVSG